MVEPLRTFSEGSEYLHYSIQDGMLIYDNIIKGSWAQPWYFAYTKSDIINIVSFHFIIIPLGNTFLLNASGPPDPPLGEYRATDINPNDLEIALPTPISIDAFQIT